MPQARSSRARSTGPKSSSKAKPAAAKRSTAAKPAAAKRSTAAKPASGTTARRSSATSSSAKATTAKAAAAGAKAAEARLEAAAQRLRKLNERIIEAGKEAGDTTLASYEKALKAIATSIESGPGKSEVEWISALATTQAKFIRDVTNAWTAAARGVLK
jgi:hypothetical protein